MTVLGRARGSVTVTYSGWDLVAVSLAAMVVTTWVGLAGGAFSARVLLASAAAFVAFYLVGSLLLSIGPLAQVAAPNMPLRLLVGYGAVNTTLLALAWLSPLGILLSFWLVFILAGGALAIFGKRQPGHADWTGFGVMALCLVATSLWCQDTIRPRAEQGDFILFKPWVDSFYHAVHIRLFGASHGAASIEDWRLAGVPARPYHYGMYLLPAFIKQASGIDSYTAFAGVLAPLGVFFTGLAAYAFVAAMWGAWPGVVAVAALLLLPDGAQQGMSNTFMSYHWLTQISPSATYGLAMLAVAWLFVLQGCQQGSWRSLVTGWAFALVVSVYKLHYLLASAFPLLLVPALFFQSPLSTRRRALWGLAACALYAALLVVAQKVPGVPLIRFDGSSVGEILRLILTFAKPGTVRDYVTPHLGPKLAVTSNLVFGIPYVLFAIFGAVLPLLGFLLWHLRRRITKLQLLFPLLLIGNFLVMFFGLALDFASSTPDELSHRPLMLVYFFVLAWVGGAAGLLLAESRYFGRRVAVALVVGCVLLLAVPAQFGAGVQQMWAMPQMAPVRLPRALLRVADYIRDHGEPEDVFQDSQFDRIYAVSALSERRTFVAHTLTRVPYRQELVETRTNAVDHFMGLRRSTAVRATAHAFGFRWFLLHRGDTVDWPEDIAAKPVLETGPFKLYEP